MKEYQEIQNRLKQDQSCILYTSWEKGDDGEAAGFRQEVRAWASSGDAPELETEIRKTGRPAVREEDGKMIMAEPFYPEDRLIVLGGGHVALPLVEFASRCGFAVTVVDDRPEFANRERFPWAAEVICREFMRALLDLKIRQQDYVCLLTRGHRFDEDCLRAILSGTEPGYLGMIGSRRHVAIVKEQLLADGYSLESLDRLHSPIGLAIGGITPEEIAVSILAELIASKRLDRESRALRNQSDLDYRVVERLAEDEGTPKAVLTVVYAEGSVPRGAGAKMIVYPDGSILGSIGGGGAEAVAMRKARELIGTGRTVLEHIDLTGDAAEENGLVCGGILDVLIQDT